MPTLERTKTLLPRFESKAKIGSLSFSKLLLCSFYVKSVIKSNSKQVQHQDNKKVVKEGSKFVIC
jgi:hypothetical protein